MHLDYLARREMPRMRIGRAGHARTSSQEGTLGEPLLRRHPMEAGSREPRIP